MAKHVLVVLSNPAKGREEEFNKWYDEVHIPEVLAVPGFVAAQRYKIGDVPGDKPLPQRYLALYEVESDNLAKTLDTLMKAVATMNMSDCIDMATVAMQPFSAIGARQVEKK